MNILNARELLQEGSVLYGAGQIAKGVEAAAALADITLAAASGAEGALTAAVLREVSWNPCKTIAKKSSEAASGAAGAITAVLRKVSRNPCKAIAKKSLKSEELSKEKAEKEKKRGVLLVILGIAGLGLAIGRKLPEAAAIARISFSL